MRQTLSKTPEHIMRHGSHRKNRSPSKPPIINHSMILRTPCITIDTTCLPGCEWDIYPQRGVLTSLAVSRDDDTEYLAHVLHSSDPSYRRLHTGTNRHLPSAKTTICNHHSMHRFYLSCLHYYLAIPATGVIPLNL